MKRPLHVFNYSIKNQANGEVDIFIDGDIVDAETQSFLKAWFGEDTSTSYKSFREQLNSVEAERFNVFINSGGGIVTDAMAIHDLIQDYRAKGKTVKTKGRGLIGSAATYILMAGDSPEMSKNSWFMIHNVSGFVGGDVNQVERYARTLRTFNDASRDFYASATGIRKEEISKMMNEETWMTAETAKQKGFISVVSGEANFSQAISKEDWPFTNTAVLNSYNASVKAPDNNNSLTQNLEEMKKFWQDLGKEIMNAIKGVKAPENNDHTALMTSIAEAINKPFDAAGEQIETVMNAAVAAEVTAKVVNVDFAVEGPAKTALDAAVAAAVTNATKDYATRITELERINGELVQKNTDLAGDITELKGAKQTAPAVPAPKAPVGNYN